MIRVWFAAAAVAIGVTAVAAQSDPVAERKGLMKANGRHYYGTLPRMIRGQDPYDQAKVDAAFAEFANMAAKLAAFYPDSSKPAANSGDQYVASAKVWENKSEFEAQIAKFAKGIEDIRPKAINLDSLKVAFPAVTQNCDGCHDVYRVKNR